MRTYELAMETAICAHDGQYNKFNGEPYILHPIRVFNNLNDRGFSDDYLAVALLHDVVEDTDITQEDLQNFFSQEICDAVGLLTKIPGVSNEDYYKGIRNNELARVVKLADIDDNISRIGRIADPDTVRRLETKYGLGIAILTIGK